MKLPVDTFILVSLIVSSARGVQGDDEGSEDYYDEYEDESQQNTTSYKPNVPDSFKHYLEHLLTKENSTSKDEAKVKEIISNKDLKTEEEKEILKNQYESNQEHSFRNKKQFDTNENLKSLADTLIKSVPDHSPRPKIFHPYAQKSFSHLLTGLGKHHSSSHGRHHEKNHKNNVESLKSSQKLINEELKKSVKSAASLVDDKSLKEGKKEETLLENQSRPYDSKPTLTSEVLSSLKSTGRTNLKDVENNLTTSSLTNDNIAALNGTVNKYSTSDSTMLTNFTLLDTFRGSSEALSQAVNNRTKVKSTAVGKEDFSHNEAILDAKKANNSSALKLSDHKKTNLENLEISESLKNHRESFDSEINDKKQSKDNYEILKYLPEVSRKVDSTSESHGSSGIEQTVNNAFSGANLAESSSVAKSENLSKTNINFGNNQTNTFATKEIKNKESNAHLNLLNSSAIMNHQNGKTINENNTIVTASNLLETNRDDVTTNDVLSSTYRNNTSVLTSDSPILQNVPVAVATYSTLNNTNSSKSQITPSSSKVQENNTNSIFKTGKTQGVQGEISNNTTKDTSVVNQINEENSNSSSTKTSLSNIESHENLILQPEKSYIMHSSNLPLFEPSKNVSFNAWSTSENVKNEDSLNLTNSLQSNKITLNSKNVLPSSTNMGHKLNTTTTTHEISKNMTNKHPIAELLDGLTHIVSNNTSRRKRKRKMKQSTKANETGYVANGKVDVDREVLSTDVLKIASNNSDDREAASLKNSSSDRNNTRIYWIGPQEIITESRNESANKSVFAKDNKHQKLSQANFQNYTNNTDKSRINISTINREENAKNELKHMNLNTSMDEEVKQSTSSSDIGHQLQNATTVDSNEKLNESSTALNLKDLSSKKEQQFVQSHVGVGGSHLNTKTEEVKSNKSLHSSSNAHLNKADVIEQVSSIINAFKIKYGLIKSDDYDSLDSDKATRTELKELGKTGVKTNRTKKPFKKRKKNGRGNRRVHTLKAENQMKILSATSNKDKANTSYTTKIQAIKRKQTDSTLSSSLGLNSSIIREKFDKPLISNANLTSYQGYNETLNSHILESGSNIKEADILSLGSNQTVVTSLNQSQAIPYMLNTQNITTVILNSPSSVINLISKKGPQIIQLNGVKIPNITKVSNGEYSSRKNDTKLYETQLLANLNTLNISSSGKRVKVHDELSANLAKTINKTHVRSDSPSDADIIKSGQSNLNNDVTNIETTEKDVPATLPENTSISKNATKIVQENIQVENGTDVKALLNDSNSILASYLLGNTNNTKKTMVNTELIGGLGSNAGSIGGVKEVFKGNDLRSTTNESFLSEAQKGSIGKTSQEKLPEPSYTNKVRAVEKTAISDLSTHQDENNSFHTKGHDTPKNNNSFSNTTKTNQSGVQTGEPENTNLAQSGVSFNKTLEHNSNKTKNSGSTHLAKSAISEPNQPEGKFSETESIDVQVRPTSVTDNNDDKSKSTKNNNHITSQYKDTNKNNQKLVRLKNGLLVKEEDVKALINNLNNLLNGSKPVDTSTHEKTEAGHDNVKKTSKSSANEVLKENTPIVSSVDKKINQHSEKIVNQVNSNLVKRPRLDTEKKQVTTSNVKHENLVRPENQVIVQNQKKTPNMIVQDREVNVEKLSENRSNDIEKKTITKESNKDVNYSNNEINTQQAQNHREHSTNNLVQLNNNPELEGNEKSTEAITSRAKPFTDIQKNTNSRTQINSSGRSDVNRIHKKDVTPESVVQENSSDYSSMSQKISQDLNKNKRVHIVIDPLDKKPNISVDIGAESDNIYKIKNQMSLENEQSDKEENSEVVTENLSGSENTGKSANSFENVNKESLTSSATTNGLKKQVAADINSNQSQTKYSVLSNRPNRTHEQVHSNSQQGVEIANDIARESSVQKEDKVSKVKCESDKRTPKEFSLEVKDSNKVVNRKRVTKKEEVVEVNEKMKENKILGKSKTVQTINTDVSSVDYV